MTLFLSIFLLLALAAGIFALMIWWRRKRYTRERFAFAGLSLLGGLSLFVLGSLLTGAAPWEKLLFVFAQLGGFDYTPATIRTTDGLLAVILLGLLGYVIVKLHSQWNGQISNQQYQREQIRQPATLLVLLEESALYLRHLRHPNDNLIQPYQPPANELPPLLEGSAARLAWKQQARELLQLRSRAYQFEDDAWNDSLHCWIGANKQSRDCVVLACYQDKAQAATPQALFDYAQKLRGKQINKYGLELIIALKHDASGQSTNINGHPVTYYSESQLLDELVDFSNCRQDICYRVEQQILPDSALTLSDMYTVADFRLKKDGARQHNLEEYIRAWLDEPSLRQLALLGEYGQGKSTTAQLLTHHLLQSQAAGERAHTVVDRIARQ